MISPKKLTIVLIIALLIQLFATVPIEYVMTRFSGDTVREGAFEILEAADETLGKIIGYAILAALGIAWYYKCLRARVTALVLIAFAVPRIAMTAEAAAQSGFASAPGGYILAIWIDSVIELILTAIVIIAGWHLRKRRYGLRKKVVGEDGRVRYVPTKYYGKKLSDITEVFLCAEVSVLALEVINELINTVSFFVSVSDPTAKEIITIVTTYMMFLVYSVIGFFVMRAVLAFTRNRRTEIADIFDQNENVR